jgi:hypothetical protein
MATHAHGEHDHDPLHGYVDGDDLPAHGPVPAEPKSPAWMSVVGVLIFAAGLVYAVSSPTDEEERTSGKAMASTFASAFGAPSASASAPPQPEGEAKPAAPAPQPLGQPHPVGKPELVRPRPRVLPAGTPLP